MGGLLGGGGGWFWGDVLLGLCIMLYECFDVLSNLLMSCHIGIGIITDCALY